MICLSHHQVVLCTGVDFFMCCLRVTICILGQALILCMQAKCWPVWIPPSTVTTFMFRWDAMAT